MMGDNSYQRLLERYQSGQVPWDDALPPPEVIEALSGLPPGRALDLGTGYGRAAIYLASLGWEVDGVDFIEMALAEARRRAEAAGVAVRFHHASVTELDFLAGPYDFALDVGCGHALEEPDLRAYCRQLQRLLRPGALLMLFARIRDEDEPVGDDGPRGVPERLVRAVFADGFALERFEAGASQVEDRAPWPSAWFWLRRGMGHG